MKEVILISSVNYEEQESYNYGNRTIINNEEALCVYDCGSTEHATVSWIM